MTRYVIWEPQPRRVTRRGLNQLCSTSSYFQKSVHWYGSRYKMRADDRDEAVRIYVDWTPNCRFLPLPSPSGRNSWPVSVVGLASDHYEGDERCHITCGMGPKEPRWGGVTAYCCGDVKTSGGVPRRSSLSRTRGERKKLLGRFIHFWVADHSQSVRRTSHLELGTKLSKRG